MKKAVKLAMLFCLLGLEPPVDAQDPNSGSSAFDPSREITSFTDVDLAASGSEAEKSSGAGCSASFSCGDGNNASCSGSFSCGAYPLAVPAFIKCDGKKYFCPNMCFVKVACSPTANVFCSSNVGDCQSGSDWVQCDGNFFPCGMIGGPD